MIEGSDKDGRWLATVENVAEQGMVSVESSRVGSLFRLWKKAWRVRDVVIFRYCEVVRFGGLYVVTGKFVGLERQQDEKGW